MTHEPTWLKDFRWDSEVQHKSYLSYLHWAKSHNLDATIPPVALYFMQKDHEASEYWLEVMSGQIKSLQMEIRILTKLLRERYP